MEYKSRKGLGFVAAGVLALAAGGAFVFAHGGMGGHGHRGAGQMAERFQSHVNHVLAEVDATPEQQSRINDIVRAATGDLDALHRQHSGALAEMHTLFTAPAIDRAKLEQLRARHIADLDAASQRWSVALADAAEVLTPEQRASLGARMKKRHAQDPQGIPHGGR